MNSFYDVKNDELMQVNGGGVGGFICGYLIGSVVALTGGTIMVFSGATEEDTKAFLYSSLITCAAVGATFTGPV